MNIRDTESYSTNDAASERVLITRDTTTSPQASNRNVSQKLRQLRLQRINKYRKQPIVTGTYLLDQKQLADCLHSKQEEIDQNASYPEVIVKMVDPSTMKIGKVENMSTFARTLGGDDKAGSVITEQYSVKSTENVKSINAKTYQTRTKTGVTSAKIHEQVLDGNNNQEEIKKQIQSKSSLAILSKSKSLIHVSFLISLKANPPFEVARMSIESNMPKTLTFQEKLCAYDLQYTDDKKQLITR
jgi:hypothetical protein